MIKPINANPFSAVISHYLLFALLFSVAVVTLSLSADDQTEQDERSTPYNSFRSESGLKGQLLGRLARDHLYLGMWSLHLKPGDDQQNTNDLLCVNWRGYYAGTFINTHNDRTWSAGWQRTLFQQKYGEIDLEVGYRGGVMYGYKKHLQIGHSRFFPLFQTVLDIDYKGLGMEFSWAGVVLTAGFYYRF